MGGNVEWGPPPSWITSNENEVGALDTEKDMDDNSEWKEAVSTDGKTYYW